MESLVFWMYTHLIYPVHGKQITLEMQRSDLSNPEFDFDMMQLFMLADYLEVTDLTDVMSENFFGVKVLFPMTTNRDHDLAEKTAACLLIKCNSLKSSALLQPLACTYVGGTAGLLCLCRWPTAYPQQTWKALMNAGRDTSILWMAHVLPLYVLRFGLSKEEAIDLLCSMNLCDWVNGCKKDVCLSDLTKGVHPAHLTCPHNAGATCITLGVPDIMWVLLNGPAFYVMFLKISCLA